MSVAERIQSDPKPLIAARWELAAGVEVSEFDGTTEHAVLVAANGRHYQMGGLAQQVVQRLQAGPRTAHRLIEEFATCPNSSESAIPDVLRKLSALGVITSDDVEHERGTPQKRKAPSYFAVRIPLLSRARVSPLTNCLAPLFSPRLVAVLLPAMLLGQIVFWLAHPGLMSHVRPLPSGNALILVVIASYAGLFLHEIGHASACTRYGVAHGPIGLAIYLIFPAAYTDVTQAWKLPRWQRAVVDAAGIQMSLLAATIATVFFLATGNRCYLVLLAVYDLTVFFNLNPFIRMDGYWLLSDALGIPNLMSVNREATAWLARRLFGRDARKPAVLASAPMTRRVYTIYYALFLVFSGYILVRLLFWYLPAVAAMYKQSIPALITTLHDSGMGLKSLGLVLRLALSSIPMIGLGVYLYRGVQRCVQALSGEPDPAVR